MNADRASLSKPYRSASILLAVLASVAVALLGWVFWTEWGGTPAVDARQLSNPDERARRLVPDPKTPLQQAAPEPPVGQAAPAPPALGPSREQWNAGLQRVWREPVPALIQRAAASGDFVEVFAARVAFRECFHVFMLSGRKIDASSALSARLEAVRERERLRCPPATLAAAGRDVGRLAVRNSGLSSDLEKAVIEAVSTAAQDPQIRNQVLGVVSSSGSVLLLQAVLPSLLMTDVLSTYGLKPDARISAMQDQALLFWRVSIEACLLRADCSEAALLDHDCETRSRCVESLESFPEQRIFGPGAQRALPFGGDPAPSAELLRDRYEQMGQVVSRMLGRP